MKVLIRHERLGLEYQIEAGDFRTRKLYRQPTGQLVTYADAGFRIISMADGQPFQPLMQER